MARVFSAVDIDEEDVKGELEEVRDRLDLGFRPVSKHKMHITLQFFRDIGSPEIERLKRAMDGIEKERFEAEVKGIGCFPSQDYIRVVWAGVENEGEFHSLYSQLSRHDIESDNDHSFKPHITLMRVKDISRNEKKKLRRTVREFENHSFGTLNVSEVKLYRSDLKEGGSEYSKLYSRSL